MTKTIILASILATTVLMISMASTPVFAPGPPQICEQIDDTNCSFSMVWDFDDTGSETGPPLVITIVNGIFQKAFGASTSVPVEGNLQGSLVGTIKTISEDTTVSGTTTTITTTVKTQSRNVNNLQGELVIDGVPYSATIKTPGYNAQQVGINEIFSSPAGSFTGDQTLLIIPIVITLCPQDQSQCLQGYGTVTKSFILSTDGVDFVSFDSSTLEAYVIGPDGIYQIGLNYIQRTLGTL